MAEEVDLNGFNSELAKSQQLLTEFCSSAEKFSTSLKPKTFQDMTVGMGMLTKSIQNLVMSASGLENSVGSMSSLTKTLEMLSKLDKLKIGHLIDVSTLKGETDAAKELIQSVMNKIVDGITKRPSTAFVSMFEPIKKQYQDVVNLYKSAPKDVKEPVFNFTDAEKRLSAIKERLKELNEYYALLKKQNAATPGGRLPMEISKTSKEIKTLEATETALVEKINQANAAQEKYNSNVLKSLDFINAAAKAYSSIQDRLNTIKITGGFEKEQAQLEQWKAKILEILAPYKEIAQCQSLIEQYSKEITNQESKQSKLAQEIANHDKYVANMQKVIEGSKERQNKKQARLNELVQSGNLRAASIYLKQEASYSRFNAVIDAMKRKQEQCNMATEKGRQEYQKYADQIEIVRAKMSQLGMGTSRLGEAMGRAKNFAEQMAMSFGVMTGAFGIANFLRQLYKITAEFQLQTKALAAIINNTREANILFKQMQTLAVESPMKLMDLNKYAKQLAAFRIETRELYSSLKMLGDISVGVGVDMGRLILAYGQVKSANYLRGQELRQFSEAGVNILGGLRDYYKDVKGIALSLNDIFDMISKRKVLFEDVDAVMKRMTESGGAFYNMQLIQSQTLYGQVQKLGDLFQIEMNNVGKSTSGMLLGFVRVVQTAIKNLRVIGTVLVSAFSVKSLINAAEATTRLAERAKSAGVSVSRLQVALQRIGILRPLRRLTSELTIANAKALLLKTNLGKLAIGAAIGAGIAVISKAISDAKERAENLRNELEELANRKYDIKGIEEQFGKKSDFKERIALLQELNEKAKEYGYRLQLPTNINAKNINKAFKDATEELRKYTEQVQYYSAMLDSGRIEKAMGKKLDRLSADFAIASQNAEALFKTLSNNITSLDYADKSLIQELTRMREDYLNDEESAIKKYGMTTDKWKHEFIKRMSELNLYKSIQNAGYGGEILQYDFLDPNLTEKQKKNIDSFAKNSVVAVNSAIRKFRRQLKREGDDLLTWGILDPAELEKKFRESYPAIVESLKKYGDYSKAEIATIVEALAGLEKGTIAKLIWKFENGTSDLEDSSFTRLMNDIFGKDFATIEQDFKIKIKVDTSDITPQQQEYLNQFLAATGSGTNVFGMNKSENKEISENLKNLARANDEVGKIIRKSGQTAQGAHEELETLWKSNESAIERYSEAIGTTEKAKKRLAGINQELGKGYTSAEQALKDLKAEQKEIDDIYDVMVWKHNKTKKTKGRAQSFVDEYQAMIDLIKKLNQEYDKLRQNFSEDDSYQKIIDNFNESFGEMPDEFKAKFKELKDIVFQSKLGTAEGEKIVKDIIEASSKLKPEEKAKLERNLQQFIDQLEAEADVEIKIRNDERLKYRVQKMFDDYNLTLEIDKLGFDTQEIADIFNITTRDLYSLQTKLEDMKNEFMGKGMEKEYRQHMRKIVEMNEKANLEMAKKYVKYLRQEYDERAKLEIEYMKKRADVYSLPFEGNVQTRILDNLKKEFEEKMSKLNWDAFRGSDAYIELFEDLGTVSTKALTDMRDKIYELKGSMKGLKPSDMKTMVEAIRKLDDEVIKRNPFKAIVESMREIKNMKMDETLTFMLQSYLGNQLTGNFAKDVKNALSEVRKQTQEKTDQKVNLEAGIDARKTAASINKWIDEELPKLVGDIHLGIIPSLDNLDVLEEQLRELGKEIDTERLKGLTSDEGLTETEKKWLAIHNVVDKLSKLKASQDLAERLGLSTEEMEQQLNDLGIEIEDLQIDAEKLASAMEQLTKKENGIKQFAEDSAKSLGELKGVFSSFMENLDYFGGTTDDLTEAWKEFGESIFDTIISALEMIPSLVSGFTAAGVAINSAMGIVGLIAEVIQLVISLLTALYKLHDAKIWHDLDKYMAQINKLKKSYEDLSSVFDDMYNTDDLAVYTTMTIEALKKTKWEYEQYQSAYRDLKKQNSEDLENIKTEIENLDEEIRLRSEKLKEELGGFGSMANMKSMAREWSDAWYDAFKETGDGLSGLEDSFDEFLDNLYKRQILNALGKKYFEGLFKDLDNILLKEGGLAENSYEFSQWANRVRETFGAFSDDAKELMNIYSSAGGLGSNLEGLQASIQGMTETTAQALEGYLNAIRLYVAEDNERLAAIANSLLSTTTTNPMLEQLRMIAANTSAMQTLLDSVVQPSGYQGTNGSGRPYIRVHAHMD